MLQTKPISIRKGILNHLQKLQDKLNNLPSYKEQVLEAKLMWQSKKKTKAQKSAFNRIEKELQKITAGNANYCCYCEENIGTNIEHIYPKGLFPSKTFVWQNFLWSCKQCNGSYKIAQFQIFERPDSSKTINLISNRQFLIPANKDAVFINPRLENPLDYFKLNLETGLLEIIAQDPSSRAYKRAAYTLELLQLNQRKTLVLARQKAYTYYISLLEEYIKNIDKSSKKCLLLQQEILSTKHPTVWKEMQRQYLQVPQIQILFNLVKEALEWDF